MANESIEGRLRDADTGAPGAGLLVEAWDTGQLSAQPVGSATSNADGAFQIPLKEAIRKRLVARRVQVYFRVLRDGMDLADTNDTVHWDPVEGLPVLVPVRLGRAEPGDPFDVHGSVVTDSVSAS